MIKSLVILLSVFATNLATVDPLTINEIRAIFYKAAEDNDVADQFFEQFEVLNTSNNGTLIGYHGMAHLLLAKHSWNPYTKLEYFYSGKDLLERSIVVDPQNVELRFLRFCVQQNAPFFLGYDDNLEEDKQKIVYGWQTITDLDLKRRIRNYMLSADCCDQQELAMFNSK